MTTHVLFSGVTASCRHIEVHRSGGFFTQLQTSEILPNNKISGRTAAIKQLLSREHTATGCTRQLTFQVLERPYQPPRP